MQLFISSPLPPPQIPEYCQSLEERDVTENSFDLIFAFDEIVALGYRESVNLAQIRTFTEMDSHEERVFEAMRKVSGCGFKIWPRLLSQIIIIESESKY